ncbi:unnamed protein product [Orchesella dallaii]|uniref:Uncharacterized protein n=1 Tax=Orchesella dallaii TaxID=48710 RepID=A0ABP1RIR3_9HEXA
MTLTLWLCRLLAAATFLHLGCSSTPGQGGQSIQTFLVELRTAQLPAIYSSFSSNFTQHGHGRHLLSSSNSTIIEEGNNCNKTEMSDEEKWKLEQEQLFRNMTTGPISLFEGKYLYENGEHKEKIDSFLRLTRNRIFPKKFLVELNRKLYKGGILPQAGKEFQPWLDSIQNKSVTIIDAGIESLTKDIESQFNEWKLPYEVMYGNLPKQVQIPSFKTDRKYRVTHLTFQLVTNNVNATFQQSTVIVNAKQLNTSLFLIPNITGAPFHLEMMDPVDSALPSNLLKQNNHVTNFTIEQLTENAKLIQNFWKDIGVPSGIGVHSVLLNEQYLYQNFLEIIKENDEDLLQVINPVREPDVAGVCYTDGDVEDDEENVCAFYLDSERQVEAVHPKAFVKVYEKANENEKRRMAVLAKNNMDKVEARVDNEVQRNLMIKLIQLADVKSHAATTELVISLQNLDEEAHLNPDFVKSVEQIEKQISAWKSEMKLSPFKITQKLSSLANFQSTRTARALTRGAASFTSAAIGHFFLTQTVVNGIVTGDTTSLAIVGSRFGYDVVTDVAAKVGMKYFSEASKVGKSAKVLGDIAGPIGSAFDVGMSVYSLTKAVQRLKAADNQYDRNDAIADIVQESVSIAVEATVTILSAVFPPFAPLIELIGALIDLLSQLAIAIFKAANEVARINSKIPLSKSEKKYVFNSRFMDWFGTRQKDYLEFLLEEQAANNMAVELNLKFLQDNPSFLGVVFPSRTLFYDGGCRLTVRHCALKNAFGCTRWEDEYTSGTGCDRNRPCMREICTDFRKDVGSWGYDEFKCHCSGNPTTGFGHPRMDSTIDFRSTKRLYWERAVPDDVSGADFKCKPGSVTYLDYKVHQDTARTDFLCENAIAILQPASKRNSTQIMLFNLEDGNDTVYLPTNDPTPNLFRVGNGGIKQFNGGSGKNEFLIDGDCSGNLRGTLTGGRSDVDAVTVLNSCAKGGILNFNGRTISTSDNKVYMQLSNIEAVNGREDESDLATVDCLTRKVALGGGKDNSRRDVIAIPTSTSCAYNVTALAGNFTTIQSSARKGTVSVLVDGRWKSAITNLDIHPTDDLTLSVIFASTQSSQVTIINNTSTNPAISETIVRKIQNGDDMKITLNYANHPQPYPQHTIYFKETVEESPYSYLLVLEAKNNEHSVFTMRDSSEKIENQPYITAPYIQIFESNSTQIPGQLVLDREALSPKVFYQLSNITANKTGPNIIQGFQGISNMFLVSAGASWEMTGGNSSDVFIISSTVGQDEEEEGEKVSRGIYGSTTSEANLFWFFELNSTLEILDGGRPCLELNSNGSFDCTNYLHFGETFQRGTVLEILLSSAMMDVALQPQLQLNGNANFMEETGQSMNSTAMSKYVQPTWKILPRPIRIPIGSVYSLSGEDFEDEHRIQLEENGNTNATFQMARNGTDLYFTNIISNNENVGEETQMELTTLIISDYFEEEREVYRNETLPVVGILPSKVTEVTVSLPGLQLVLNNSQIIFEQVNSQLSTSNRRNTVANILTELRDWTLLLREAESSILKNI